MTTEQFNSQQGSQDLDMSGAVEAGINHAAEDLANRNDQTTQVGGSNDLAGEQQLLSLQRDLSAAANAGDLLRVDALEAQVNDLAASLVGAAPTRAAQQVEDEYEEQEDLNDFLRDQYPDHQVYLQNASKVLGTERSQQFNSLLESGVESQSKAAMETLKTLNDSPEFFSTANTNAVLNSDQVSWASETFGEDIASSIRTLSDVVNSGQVSAAEAIKVASRDPKVLSALLTGAKAGMWTLAL